MRISRIIPRELDNATLDQSSVQLSAADVVYSTLDEMKIKLTIR